MDLQQEYDVVVVGTGGGALTGAALAAKAGLSTLVLERTPLIGGTSAYSGGACWLPGTDVQQRAGLPDSTEGARTYLAAVLKEADQERVEALLAQAPKLVAQLEADELMDFEWIPFSEYYDAPGRVPMGRSIQPKNIKRADLHPAVGELLRPPVERDRAGEGGRNTLSGGQSLIGRLAAIVLRDGGTIATGHHVTGFQRDETGRVTTVIADGPDGPVEITATRGVLIAAGGFEGSPERRAEHGTPGRAEWTMAPQGTNTGEVIDAAAAIGGATDWSGEGWFCPGLLQPDGSGAFTLGFRGGLMVDQSAQRYGNECLPYDQFGRVMAESAARTPSWFVFDSREGGALPAIAIPEGDRAEHLAAGTWVQADSIEELALAAGLEAAALTATVERFNGFTTTGVDEDFGRGTDEYDTFFASAGKPNKALVALDQPPYFAAKFVLSDLGTKGGLVTDASARVLDEAGTPIPGLYAASNSTASVFGSAYPGPGAPLGAAMAFASLAVEDMLD
ncbi:MULTISPECIES: FAD-dependent oxidoreductase [unclassified Nocardioides]|uniref:FAD-dependent oxidoreductase n=1 Tax=unclassified Nocardioides TaxID=2615069 RepID=UPI0006FC232A|nr:MULTISPECIES: FAD-dependent oxidoreductase [unclassified Nocardioides]KRA29885.1 3-oxosteroid 1-dehydrogenase [Nocardioides sp. Root614]KRA86806.1 3-oxosteroid 1-dehydrogenase [Nocardioides sp. Root682]